MGACSSLANACEPARVAEPERFDARSGWTLCERGLDFPNGKIPICAADTQGRFTMPMTEKDHVYKILELVGSSEKSIEDAIQNAVGRAAKTIREMKWFEVVQTRGHIEKGTVRHYQVTLRVGFTLEE